jgi:hypothetical protein
MKQPDRRRERTLEDMHKAFERRARVVFRFLVVDFGFKLVRRPRNRPRDLRRDTSVGYIKDDDVYVLLRCEAICQYVLLGSRRRGTTPVGLHQAMKVRCPELTIPPAPDDEVEAELRQQLEFCARVLREGFKDFLEGDPSVLDSVR